jgi:hypothetical protein
VLPLLHKKVGWQTGKSWTPLRLRLPSIKHCHPAVQLYYLTRLHRNVITDLEDKSFGGRTGTDALTNDRVSKLYLCVHVVDEHQI